MDQTTKTGCRKVYIKLIRVDTSKMQERLYDALGRNLVLEDMVLSFSKELLELRKNNKRDESKMMDIEDKYIGFSKRAEGTEL